VETSSLALTDILRSTPDVSSPIDVPGATRDDLASAFAQFGYKRGAEIGVERGLYSEVLLEHNPNLYLLCVDAWKAYRGYREHVTQEKLDGFYEDTRLRLSRFYGRCQLVRQFSVDAAKEVPDRSLDFVYIDGNHALLHVIADLAAWEPKVRKGGIVAGHDYRRDKKDNAPFHVPYAIQAWTKAYHIAPWYVLRGEKSATWLWVKA